MIKLKNNQREQENYSNYLNKENLKKNNLFYLMKISSIIKNKINVRFFLFFYEILKLVSNENIKIYIIILKYSKKV